MKKLHVNALNFDSNLWRVDWFGKLAVPNSFMRWTQRSLLVSLSPYASELPAPEKHPPFKQTNDHNLKQVWISIGQLPLLRVGDIWQSGKLISQPDYHLETFENLLISPENTMLLKAGISLDDGKFVLPLREHPWHRNHTQSYCLQVTLPDDRRLIIPCWELIRFYFGSSSNFLVHLFQPDLKRERLYTEIKFNQRIRQLHLQLASGISGRSASDIGRLALDPTAWGAARSVGASCLKSSLQGESIYPYTRFPFEGKTNLLASGQWLSFGDKKNATFVVFSLRSCSHPFPFNSLRYEAATYKKNEIPVHNADANDKETAKPLMASVKEENGTVTLMDEDPGKTKTPKSRSFESGAKFPDLTEKPIWRSAGVNLNASNGYVLVKADGSLENIESNGPPVNLKKIRSVDLEEELDAASAKTDTPKLPSFLKEAIKAFQKNQRPNAKLKLIFPNHSKSPVFKAPLVIDENGEIHPSSFFKYPNGSHRERRAAVIHVVERYGERLIVVLEGVNEEATHQRIEVPNFDSEEQIDHKSIVRHITNSLLDGIS